MITLKAYRRYNERLFLRMVITFAAISATVLLIL